MTAFSDYGGFVGDWPTGHPPKDGDKAAACSHLRAAPSGRVHIFHCIDSLAFEHPTGETAEVQWILLCPECFTAYRDDATAAELTQVALLKGFAKRG